MLKTRLATKADAEELLAIYTPYVTDTTITFEYNVPSLAEFEHRIETTLKDYPYVVAETEDGRIVGYSYAHRMRERLAYDWTVEISIYVDQEARGLGTGRYLYAALEKELARQNITSLIVCINGENLNSINFHEHLGYHRVGAFEKAGYKFGQWYDIVWMQKPINDPEHPEKFIPYEQLNKINTPNIMFLLE
jgi:Sortase and related acyltransferases